MHFIISPSDCNVHHTPWLVKCTVEHVLYLGFLLVIYLLIFRLCFFSCKHRNSNGYPWGWRYAPSLFRILPLISVLIPIVGLYSPFPTGTLPCLVYDSFMGILIVYPRGSHFAFWFPLFPLFFLVVYLGIGFLSLYWHKKNNNINSNL